LLSMHTLLLSHTHLCLHRSLSVSCVPFFCRSVSYFLIFIFFFLFTRQSFLHPLWQLTSLSLSLSLSLSHLSLMSSDFCPLKGWNPVRCGEAGLSGEAGPERPNEC